MALCCPGILPRYLSGRKRLHTLQAPTYPPEGPPRYPSGLHPFRRIIGNRPAAPPLWLPCLSGDSWHLPPPVAKQNRPPPWYWLPPIRRKQGRKRNPALFPPWYPVRLPCLKAGPFFTFRKKPARRPSNERPDPLVAFWQALPPVSPVAPEGKEFQRFPAFLPEVLPWYFPGAPIGPYSTRGKARPWYLSGSLSASRWCFPFVLAPCPCSPCDRWPLSTFRLKTGRRTLSRLPGTRRKACPDSWPGPLL